MFLFYWISENLYYAYVQFDSLIVCYIVFNSSQIHMAQSVLSQGSHVEISIAQKRI